MKFLGRTLFSPLVILIYILVCSIKIQPNLFVILPLLLSIRFQNQTKPKQGNPNQTTFSSFSGKYFCSASNRGGSQSIYTEVVLKVPEATKIIWAGVSITTIILFALGAFAIFYCYHKWKLRSEKSKYNKILDTFKMGDPKGQREQLRRAHDISLVPHYLQL